MKIATGTTLVFETGEYSDYSFTGPFRVLRDFDQAEVVQEYKDQWKAPDEWTDAPDGDGFVAWMATAGYVEDVPNVVSWHVGSYGSLEPVIQAEPVQPT